MRGRNGREPFEGEERTQRAPEGVFGEGGGFDQGKKPRKRRELICNRPRSPRDEKKTSSSERPRKKSEQVIVQNVRICTNGGDRKDFKKGNE